MRIQRIEFADGAAVSLVRRPAWRPAPDVLVAGYCAQCGTYALGPRHSPSVPSDRVDWITGHDGCPGYQPSDRERRRTTRPTPEERTHG